MKRRGFRRSFYVGKNTRRHGLYHVRQLQVGHGGAYGKDLQDVDPDWQDLPETCAFTEDGLLPNPKSNRPFPSCEGELVVVEDKRFGAIPVCQGHLKWVQHK